MKLTPSSANGLFLSRHGQLSQSCSPILCILQWLLETHRALQSTEHLLVSPHFRLTFVFFFRSRIFYLADSRAQYPDASHPNPYSKYARPDSIPEAYDIPIGLVNRVLYDPIVRPEQTTERM